VKKFTADPTFGKIQSELFAFVEREFASVFRAIRERSDDADDLLRVRFPETLSGESNYNTEAI
jgi:predicted Zn-dependent peptidase